MADIQFKELKINKLDNNCFMTVKIKITKQFKFRVFLATRFIKIAAWLLGCNIEIMNDAEIG